MEDLHDGISTADEATAFAQLAHQVLRTAEVEQRQKVLELEERQTALEEAEERRNNIRMLSHG